MKKSGNQPEKEGPRPPDETSPPPAVPGRTGGLAKPEVTWASVKKTLQPLVLVLGAAISLVIAGSVGWVGRELWQNYQARSMAQKAEATFDEFKANLRETTKPKRFDICVLPVIRSAAGRLEVDTSTTEEFVAELDFEFREPSPWFDYHDFSARPVGADEARELFSLAKHLNLVVHASLRTTGEQPTSIHWEILWPSEQYPDEVSGFSGSLSIDGPRHRIPATRPQYTRLGSFESYYPEAVAAIRVLYGIWLVEDQDVNFGYKYLLDLPDTAIEAKIASLAYLVSKREHLDAAAKISADLLQEFPDDRVVLNLAAKMALWRGDWNQAASYAKDATDRHPESSDAWHVAGLAYLYRGEYERAVSALENIPRSRRLGKQAFLCAYLHALVRVRDLDNAAEYALIGLETIGPAGWLYTFIGAIAETQWHNTGKDAYFQAAMENYQKALSEDPTDLHATRRLGGLLLPTDCEKALTLVHQSLLNGYNSRRQTEALPDLLSHPAAATCWDAWYQTASESLSRPILVLMEAFKLVFQQEWALAKAKAKEAYRLKPDLTPAYVLSGWCSWAMARLERQQRPEEDNTLDIYPDETYKEYEAAATFGSNNVIALNYYATALYERKEYEEARDILKRVITLDPYYSEPYWRLARVTLKSGAKEETELRDALENVRIALRHGAVHQLIGEYQATESELLEMLDQSEAALEAARAALRHRLSAQTERDVKSRLSRLEENQ